MKNIVKTVLWHIRKEKLRKQLFNYCSIEYKNNDAPIMCEHLLTVCKEIHFKGKVNV